MTSAAGGRRFRYSLRTLFLVLTALGLWLFPQGRWIRERHQALRWVGSRADYWRDVPVSQRAIPGAQAPWQLRLLGEGGVERISVVTSADDAAAKQRELELLFPEAEVLVLTPGPGYQGVHTAQ